MTVVAVKTLVGEERYNEFLNGDQFYGREFTFIIGNEFYFKVEDAIRLGYFVLPTLVEVI